MSKKNQRLIPVDVGLDIPLRMPGLTKTIPSSDPQRAAKLLDKLVREQSIRQAEAAKVEAAAAERRKKRREERIAEEARRTAEKREATRLPLPREEAQEAYTEKIEEIDSLKHELEQLKHELDDALKHIKGLPVFFRGRYR